MTEIPASIPARSPGAGSASAGVASNGFGLGSCRAGSGGERGPAELSVLRGLALVGATGFEPATSCTPSKRAKPSCATPRLSCFWFDSPTLPPDAGLRFLTVPLSHRKGFLSRSPSRSGESKGGYGGVAQTASENGLSFPARSTAVTTN